VRFWLQALQPAATHNDESHASWCVNNGYPVLQILTCTLPNIDQPIIVSRRRLTLSWLTLMKRKGHPLTFNAPYIYSRVGSVPCKMYLSLRIACTMECTRLWTWHSLINKSNEGHGYSKVLKTFIQGVEERYDGGETAERNVGRVKWTNTFCFLSEGSHFWQFIVMATIVTALRLAMGPYILLNCGAGCSFPAGTISRALADQPRTSGTEINNVRGEINNVRSYIFTSWYAQGHH